MSWYRSRTGQSPSFVVTSSRPLAKGHTRLESSSDVPLVRLMDGYGLNTNCGKAKLHAPQTRSCWLDPLGVALVLAGYTNE